MGGIKKKAEQLAQPKQFCLFDQVYAAAIGQIMDATPSLNSRTGKLVRARPGIALHIPPGHYPLLRLRDIRPLWTCAETVWFMGGRFDSEWMESFNFKVWKEFADQQGNVWSSAGYRWRKNFQDGDGYEIDQIKVIMQKLTADPSNRQAVLLSWDPRRDLVNPGPNAPCVMIMHFHIIDKQLFVSVLQRSADMYFGLPHDILGAKLIQDLLAAGLGVKSGGISYLISNAHLYEDQWHAAEEMMYRAESMDGEGECKWDLGEWSLGLTKDDFARAMVADKSLVIDMHQKIMKRYKPWPPIIGPKLVK